MRSESPGTPGRRQQMPRTMRSISTPAWLAAYSSSISAGSTRLFILAMMRAGRPGAGVLGLAADALDAAPSRRSVGATNR